MRSDGLEPKISACASAEARHVETWRTLVSAERVSFSGILCSELNVFAPIKLLFCTLTYSPADVTPRKKHKKDKHKSGEEEPGISVMRACKTIDYKHAML